MADTDFDAIEFGKLRRSKTQRWIRLVKSIEVDFAGPGDSGALVFAVENTETVPLGILLGSPFAGHCLFLSLETYVIEGRLNGLPLEFSE
jgi:hypothetical protein